MRRRDFITLLSGGAAWPLVARAQQTKPVVGLLAGGTAKAYAQLLSAFLQGLNETGYIEGRSVAIEQRWAEGNYQRLPALADDLVQRQVSVLVALTTPAALVAKAATATIPSRYNVNEAWVCHRSKKAWVEINRASHANAVYELSKADFDYLHRRLPPLPPQAFRSSDK